MIRKIPRLANWIVRICGSAIFLFLSWYAMRYTQYMNPGGEEMPLNVQDSMLRNVLVLCLGIGVFCGLYLLEERLSPKMCKWVRTGAICLTMVWISVWSMWWITSAVRMPEGDQAYLYGGASMFLTGNYEYLEPGGYCTIYPHQLGLMALTEILFIFAGLHNFFAFQVVNVLFAAASVYVGYRLVRECSERMCVAVMYCFAMLGCFPLIFYTGWVYGEIASIFFILFTAWMLLRYSKAGKNGYLIATVCFLAFGVLVRKNSLILLIAFCLVAAVWAILRKDKKILLAAVFAVLLPMLLYAGVYKMYEIRSGYEHSKGLPAESWIAMGFQENNGQCGWYSAYPKTVYYEQDCNRDITTMIVRREISDRIEIFMQAPSYALGFFKEKILSQWNQPLYQSLYFTTKYKEDAHRPPADNFAAAVEGRYFVKLLHICDRLQFFLFFGMLLYFLLAVKPDSNILQHLLPIMIIGGFLFSIIWEAKARYVFPYYIVMFPLAVVGYWTALEQVLALIDSRRRLQHRIIKFKRAA